MFLLHVTLRKCLDSKPCWYPNIIAKPAFKKLKLKLNSSVLISQAAK